MQLLKCACCWASLLNGRASPGLCHVAGETCRAELVLESSKGAYYGQAVKVCVIGSTRVRSVQAMKSLFQHTRVHPHSATSKAAETPYAHHLVSRHRLRNQRRLCSQAWRDGVLSGHAQGGGLSLLTHLCMPIERGCTVLIDATCPTVQVGGHAGGALA